MQNNIINIERFRKNKKIMKYNIKPLSVELEITNKCNQQCMHCGMAANKIIGKNNWKKTELEKLIDDLVKFGIPSISFTGGEPFLEFENMCHTINYGKDRLNVSKILTNGFWGYDAEKYLKKLIESGLLNNKFLTPCILLSIGEQTVPLEYLCNIINYIVSNTSKKQLDITITHIREYGEESRIDSFIELYNSLYNSFPYDRVNITEYYYSNTRCMEVKVNNVCKKSIYEFIVNAESCFEDDLYDRVTPKILIKCSGICYSCSCFNVAKQLRLGNYFDIGLESIVNELNTNKYVKFIEQNGLIGFKKIIPSNILYNTYVENCCSACDFCLDYCEKNHIILD